MKLRKNGIILKESEIPDFVAVIKNTFATGTADNFEIEVTNIANQNTLILCSDHSGGSRSLILKKYILNAIKDWCDDCSYNSEDLKPFCEE